LPANVDYTTGLARVPELSGRKNMEIKSTIHASERTVKQYIDREEEDIPAVKKVVIKKPEDAVKKAQEKADLVKS
jgi:hypothetical protein